MDPYKIKAINDWPVPKDVTGIRSFMGITDYYRIRFVKEFSKISYPITSLQKKGTKFIWSNKCQEIFEKLKHLLTTAPILRVAYPYKDFVVCTDAFLKGLGGVLLQEDYVISYESRKKNYMNKTMQHMTWN